MNIVITGTSSGLGAELFYRFKNSGHITIGSSHDKPEMWPQLHLDFNDMDSIAEFASRTLMAMNGRVDILINNAGANGICKFEDLDPSFIARMLTVNFIGPVMLTQLLLPGLKQGGKVINVVSDAAWRPMRHSLAYNCSKAAMAMATKQMARELTKPCDVSIMSVNPGKMKDTGMSKYIDEQVCALRGWTPEQARAYAEASSVTGKELPPELVADLIYTIAMGMLPKFMSGACMDLVG